MVKIKEVRYSEGLRTLAVIDPKECGFPAVATVVVRVEASGSYTTFFKQWEQR